MVRNTIRQTGWELSVAVTDPATPSAGDPVRFGVFTGIALTDEGDGGNDATKTTVYFGPCVSEMVVKAINDGGDSAVTVGDAIFYVDGDTPKLSKKGSGYLFGFALEAIDSGETGTIRVLKVATPGAGTLAAGSVGAAQLASDFLNAEFTAEVANDDTSGGLPLIFAIAIAGGAAGDVDVVMDHKVRVIDVWAVHTSAGEADDTLTVKNGADAITDAMPWAGSDKDVVRAAEIDDATHVVDASGTLRVTTTDNDTDDDVASGIVYVLAMRVA